MHGKSDRVSVVEAAQRFYGEVGVPKENITLVTRPMPAHLLTVALDTPVS